MTSLPMHPDDVVEYLDNEEELRIKVQQLATWLKQAKHAVAFTGAGISTAAGIPDFRSGMSTMADSGPGVWELAARGLTPAAGQRRCTRGTMRAMPTAAHMMLVELEKRGLVKHLVSVNTDGLHRRSGFPSAKLSELYGNVNTEQCRVCGKVFSRDFFVRRMSNAVHDHSTGRLCHCGGFLHDTIVNFNEPLTVQSAKTNLDRCDSADLCLAMGSSLHVAPAGDIATMIRNNGGRLVIVNLQATPMDVNADLVIHAKCEDVAQVLTRQLGIPLAPWILRRQIIIDTTPVDVSPINGNVCTVVIEGRDAEGQPLQLVKDVVITSPVQRDLRFQLHDTPMGHAFTVNDVHGGQVLEVELHFFGHYDEPPLKLNTQIGVRGTHQAFVIQLDPRRSSPEWEIRSTPQLM